MRRDVIGLGIALAVGGLAYGAHRLVVVTSPSPPAVSASIVALPAAPLPRLELVAAPPPRRTPISVHVRSAAARYRIPERLVTAVIAVESEYDPRAVSRRGALGLMQLMPATATLLGVRNAFDPAENVDGGVRHLRELLDRFANDLPLALAAYNAGVGAVIRYGGVPPFPETRAFVARVLSRFGEAPRPPSARPGDVPPAPRVRLAAHLTADRVRRDDDIVVVAVSTAGRDEWVPVERPAEPVTPERRPEDHDDRPPITVASRPVTEAP